jgi:hypothetical protein
MTGRSVSGIQRIRFEEGGLLLGTDLNDRARMESRLLELHVQGVHDTWGIANGLQVELSADRRWVLINSGTAFDRGGRVVSLAAAVTMPAPIAGVFGVLQPSFDLLLDQGRVRWETAGDASDKNIPLARCIRLADGTLLGIDRTVRRTLRPMTRPHVGFGMTLPGELKWFAGSYGLRAVVDTSEAGFTATPYYFAQIAALDALPLGYIPPFLSLAWFYSNHFSVRLNFVTTVGRTAALALQEMLRLAPSIRLAWIGVETLVGCSAGAPGGFV